MRIAHSKLAHVMADWMGVEGRVQRVRLLDPGIGLTPDFPFFHERRATLNYR